MSKEQNYTQLANGTYETLDGKTIAYGFDPKEDDLSEYLECHRCGVLCPESELKGNGHYHLCEHCE